jgi:predicted glycosyltransferase
MISGPFMPKKIRESIKKRAKRHGIKTFPFHPRMEELIQAADMVISMGGYNTVCELLTQQTPALLIPRETPRKEQLIRARCLKSRKLVDYIAWNEVTPQLLKEKIFSVLTNNKEFLDSMTEFDLTGLTTMHQRLEQFKKESIRELSETPLPAHTDELAQ